MGRLTNVLVLAIVVILVWEFAIQPITEDEDVTEVGTLTIVTASQPYVICDEQRGQYTPIIDGDFVVWTDYRNGNYDVYGYNITTGTEYVIANTVYLEQMKEFANGKIAYQLQNDSKYELWIYNLTEHTRFMVDNDIKSASNINSNIQIGDRYIAYVRTTTEPLWIYDLETSNKINVVGYAGNIISVWDALEDVLIFHVAAYMNAMYVYDMEHNTTTLVASGFNSIIYGGFIDEGNVALCRYSTVGAGEKVWSYYRHNLQTSATISLFEMYDEGLIYTSRFSDVSEQFICGWNQTIATGTYDPFVYDFINEEFINITINEANSQSISVSGNRLVFQEYAVSADSNIGGITLFGVEGYDDEENGDTNGVDDDGGGIAKDISDAVGELADAIAGNSYCTIGFIIGLIILGYIGYNYYKKRNTKGGKK